MDGNNKTNEADNRSPLKELNLKNNKPAEACDNQNKNVNLFDMDSSFLKSSMMIPADFDSNENGDPDVTNNSNQENQKPRYSNLNIFDPLVKKETDEVKILESCNDNLLNANELNKSDDFLNALNPIVEVIAEKPVETSTAVNDTLNCGATELDKSALANISTQSDNSLLNNTVILNKSLTADNNTPEQSFIDNRSLNDSSTVEPTDLSLPVSDDSFIRDLKSIDQTLDDANGNTSLIFSTTLKQSEQIETAIDESNIENTNDITENIRSELSSEIPYEISVESLKIVNDLTEEPSNNPSIEINEAPETVTNDTKDISFEINKSDSETNEKINETLNKEQIKECSSLENKNISFDINKSNSEANEKLSETLIKEDIKVCSLENKNISFDINKSNSEANEKLSETLNKEDIKVCSLENKNISFDINKSNSEANEKLSETLNKEEIKECSLENKNISFDINKSNLGVNEKLSEPLIIEDIKECSLGNTNISFDINKSNSKANEKLSETFNKEEIKECSLENKNISFDINKSNSGANEKLSKPLIIEDIKQCSLENKNVSFEVVTNTGSEIVEDPIEINKINQEEINEVACPSQLSTSTYENQSVITSSTLAEQLHMSASEPNSDLNEPTVANRLSLDTNAACTNEMGEIINQNECFEKQSDITNGAIDNKESLEAKARVYQEMADKYAIAEAECEKYKVQVTDLKKELKNYRQKTIALENEVADLKRRESELNVLIEEFKQSAASKDDATDQDEQLHRLQASEEALKNEVKELTALVNQHETRLKELQRKEVKLADDLTTKTLSEIEINRVMEEYEKSISSLMSENEKMKKDRDTAQMHLANIELAFSDVHQKYERCKQIVQGYKDNEESFKNDIAINRETIVIQEQKYESLKAHAMNQLEISNQELTTMKKQHETEMTRLTAQLKRYEIKNQSLMESLQQKAKECEQLSAVCDEFIGNV